MSPTWKNTTQICWGQRYPQNCKKYPEIWRNSLEVLSRGCYNTSVLFLILFLHKFDLYSKCVWLHAGSVLQLTCCPQGSEIIVRKILAQHIPQPATPNCKLSPSLQTNGLHLMTIASWFSYAYALAVWCEAICLGEQNLNRKWCSPNVALYSASLIVNTFQLRHYWLSYFPVAISRGAVPGETQPAMPLRPP